MSMLKFVFAFCALILVSVSAIYAKDDKWIDGIKIRAGSVNYRNEIMMGDHLVNERMDSSSSESRFPFVITFPETLMNSWSFRDIYFDYNSYEKLNMMKPYPGHDGLSQERSWVKSKGESFFI